MQVAMPSNRNSGHRYFRHPVCWEQHTGEHERREGQQLALSVSSIAKFRCTQVSFQSLVLHMRESSWAFLSLLSTVLLHFPLQLRLCYFYATEPKLRLLENVTTGQIKAMTDRALADDYHTRYVVTNPAETQTSIQQMIFEHIMSELCHLCM